MAGAAPIWDYLQYRWVYRVPLAILATGLAILSTLSLMIGLILETQLRYHNELFALLRKRFEPNSSGEDDQRTLHRGAPPTKNYTPHSG